MDGRVKEKLIKEERFNGFTVMLWEVWEKTYTYKIIDEEGDEYDYDEGINGNADPDLIIENIKEHGQF